MEEAKTLIVGGTGTVGRELLSLLCTDNCAIRLLLRPTSTASLPTSAQLSLAYGDLDDSDSLTKALKGIQQVFMLTPDQARQDVVEEKLITLAKQAGVRKIVKSSAFAAGLQPPPGYGITHARAEQALMNSGLQWIILRPYMFMQNFLELADLIKSPGLLPLPLGKARVNLIDARDVALAAKTALNKTGLESRVYELSGPQALPLAECARLMSAQLLRKIRYLPAPVWLASLMMRRQGVPAWHIDMRKQLFKMIREGGEAGSSPDFETLVGTAPRSLQQFIDDHKAAFS